METDELRRLRARAYGPDADITGDPAALARLEELEAAQRAPEPAEAPEPARAPAPAEGEAPVGVAPLPAEPTPTNAVAPEPVTHAPAPARGWRGWSRRRAAVVGAVVLVLAVVVAVGATSFVTRRSGYAAPVDAVIAESPGRDIPEILGVTSDAGRVFDDFAGFTPVAAALAWNGPVDGDCLVLVESEYIDTATPNSFSGTVLWGCGAGPFAATVSLLVGPSTPQAMRDRYPDGTAVQFLLEGDEIVVLESPPETVETPAA